MLANFLEKVFGENWRTTFYGFLAGVCSFFAVNIDLLEPLPDYWEKFAKQLIAFLMGAGLFQLGRSSRDNAASENSIHKIEEKIHQIEKHEKF